MSQGTRYLGYLRNDTLFDGSGDKTPIEAGDAVNISFFSKIIGAQGGVYNKVNVYLSQNGVSEWTCIVGKRAAGQTTEEAFSPSTEWTKYNYTAEAPSTDGDNDYIGGNAVATWSSCSIQVTGSYFVPTGMNPNSSVTLSTAYDDFKVTANKPQVHVSNEGILIYQTGDNYIEMGASGLNVKGGTIDSNTINAPAISSEDFRVKNQISNYLTGSDISLRTADTQDEASGDLYLIGGTCSTGATTSGGGGGTIHLLPGSGSGTDGPMQNGDGIVIIGPCETPRVVISGSKDPQGDTDPEIQFKDETGEFASLFWSKQENSNGTMYMKTTQADSSIVLGAGAWGGHLLIREDGEVHIPGSGNDAAQSHRLFVTGNVKIDSGALGVDATASSTVGHIRAADDVVAFYSDERLKEKITIGIENSIDKIKNINTFTYRHNELANTFGFKGDKTYIGVGAKSVKESLPEAVEIAPFDADKDGNSESGDDYLTVQYERIVPLLIEGIKEQQIQIDELRKELEDIKNE